MDKSSEHEIRQLKEDYSVRNRQLEAIHRITTALYLITDIKALLQLTLQTGLEVVGAQAGSLLLHDKEKDELVFKYVIGKAADKLIGKSIPASKGIAGRVFRTREAGICDDVLRDECYAFDISDKIGYATYNMITVPLRTEHSCLGVLQAVNKEKGDFDETDMSVLDVLSGQAALALERINLEEKARLSQIVKLIGDISHDVKNLVTPIVSGILTLESFYRSTFGKFDKSLQNETNITTDQLHKIFEKYRSFFPEAVSLILEGAENVQARAREIADAVKGETSEPCFEPANINSIARSVEHTLQAVAQREGIRIDLTGLNEVPEINIDKKLIHTALYNLINNAISETDSGGVIYVRSKSAHSSAFSEGSSIVMEVEDTGRGMHENIRQKLFTSETISTKPGGTGLGTRIVKKAIEIHKGLITVESTTGKGSKFTIQLPLHQP